MPICKLQCAFMIWFYQLERFGILRIMYCNFVTGACISSSCTCFCSLSVPWSRILLFIVLCNLFKLHVGLHTNSALIQNAAIATEVAAPLNIIGDQIVPQRNVKGSIFSSMFSILIIWTFIHTWIGHEWYFVFNVRSTIVQPFFCSLYDH